MQDAEWIRCPVCGNKTRGRTCGIDNRGYLCKARPSAEKAAEDFITS